MYLFVKIYFFFGFFFVVTLAFLFETLDGGDDVDEDDEDGDVDEEDEDDVVLFNSILFTRSSISDVCIHSVSYLLYRTLRPR